jgi:tetratricopeptide (TPR) repeat protein
MTIRHSAVAGAIAVCVAGQPSPVQFEQLTTEGWNAARAAAATGGTPESLAPAVRALQDLEKIAASSGWRLQREYARALISAAMAAAQDEHGELDLYLTHARDLSERLRMSKAPAEWPLPIDEAEGELLFEVDRYPEAVRAFQRAVANAPRGGAYLGLARSAARLRDMALACDSYRRWLMIAPEGATVQEARDYLAGCP